MHTATDPVAFFAHVLLNPAPYTTTCVEVIRKKLQTDLPLHMHAASKKPTRIDVTIYFDNHEDRDTDGRYDMITSALWIECGK